MRKVGISETRSNADLRIYSFSADVDDSTHSLAGVNNSKVDHE